MFASTQAVFIRNWGHTPDVTTIIVLLLLNITVLSRKTGHTLLIWRPSLLKYNICCKLLSGHMDVYTSV